MSWRSLFHLDNPNGEVGRQFNGTLTISGDTPLSVGVNQVFNLYYFDTLPIGVYSIFTFFAFYKTTDTITNKVITGISTSPVSSVFQKSYINTSLTQITTGLGSVPNYNSSYMIYKVTNANPIYINILSTISSGNAVLEPANSFFCIATKLA